jgi:hypothetical protein
MMVTIATSSSTPHAAKMRINPVPPTPDIRGPLPGLVPLPTNVGPSASFEVLVKPGISVGNASLKEDGAARRLVSGLVDDIWRRSTCR